MGVESRTEHVKPIIEQLEDLGISITNGVMRLEIQLKVTGSAVVYDQGSVAIPLVYKDGIVSINKAEYFGANTSIIAKSLKPKAPASNVVSLDERRKNALPEVDLMSLHVISRPDILGDFRRSTKAHTEPNLDISQLAASISIATETIWPNQKRVEEQFDKFYENLEKVRDELRLAVLAGKTPARHTSGRKDQE